MCGLHHVEEDEHRIQRPLERPNVGKSRKSSIRSFRNRRDRRWIMKVMKKEVEAEQREKREAGREASWTRRFT